MKQVLQHLATGETLIEDLPCPQVKRGHLLIKSHLSLISSGTERMLVDFAKAGWLEKAKQQPEKVKQVLNKIKTDGLIPTVEAVRSTLDQPMPLGYCNVGEVIGVGDGVIGFSVGDRVVSNGNHAEVVNIPQNLCAKIPSDVDDEMAAFTVLGAIALQGVRLTKPTLGESFVVIGLGLIGQLTVQLLKAQGCRVLGVDFDASKCKMAEEVGAESFCITEGDNPLAKAQEFSRGLGVDGVIITAATSSDEPMHHAAQMCRKRGRIVLVGVTGLNLLRGDFYEKELSFQVSCSYGPGRYDSNYEQKGQDYPLAFVRWTEQRNFVAILDMMTEDKIKTQDFISHKYKIDQAPDAYNLLSSGNPALGILIEYPREAHDPEVRNQTLKLAPSKATSDEPVNVSFIGAGAYATKVLIPGFKKTNIPLYSMSHTGAPTGTHHAKKMGFESVTTDSEQILNDPKASAVVIATPHNSHAHFVNEALKKGKHVFVEKPLAITLDEMDEIEKTYHDVCAQGKSPKLMIGFNRRFSPLTVKMMSLLKDISAPKTMIMTVNAGAIPKEHWTQDPKVGGGRIIGEGCHFIDLLRFIAGSPIESYHVDKISFHNSDEIDNDKATITLKFQDGSLGTVHYFANGAKSFPKERLEVFCNSQTLVLDNFRKLTGYDWPGFSSMKLYKQNKGQHNGVEAFVKSLKENTPTPISIEEIFEISRVSIEIAEKLK